MTQEEKAKRFDEALKMAKEQHQYPWVRENKDVLEEIFPELKESEDERIRKEIVRFIQMEVEDEIVGNKWLAWLEKQGWQKLIIGMKSPEESLGISSKEYNEIVDACLYGESKSADKVEPNDYISIDPHFFNTTDKVEPKFKVGDWVVFNNKHQSIYQVEKIEDGYYILRHTHGGTFRVCVLHDESLRLWDISKDAKDGDVLADKDNNIGIYKGIEDIYWDSYIYLGCDGKLRGFSIGGKHEQLGTHPATKEQRDTLMKTMADAGYTFDFEKKELKKIEQNFAWSEEDEEFLRRAINATKDVYPVTANWLKSLKDRLLGKSIK